MQGLLGFLLLVPIPVTIWFVVYILLGGTWGKNIVLMLLGAAAIFVSLQAGAALLLGGTG